MTRDNSGAGDSFLVSGGEIPGSQGRPAFSLSGQVPSAIPVLIAVPHAGRDYTGCLIERMRHPGHAALRLEDRYVDRLAGEVARQTGASLLLAHAPRAMIDLNRAEDDVDWDMFTRERGAPPRADVGSYTPGRRSRSGLGLIPRRLPGLGELWKHHHDEADLEARVCGIYRPYHAALTEALGDLRDRWGAALLLDMHSMPPLTLHGGQPAPEFVLGDRFGTTCHGSLVGAAFSYFADLRRGAAHNRPYAGGHVLDRHAAPRRGLHALQLEIDRSSYLESRLSEPGPGFAAMVHLLVGLVRCLAERVALLGHQAAPDFWAEAAE